MQFHFCILVSNKLSYVSVLYNTSTGMECQTNGQGLNQDFDNRVFKMGFQEDRVSKPPR